MTNPAFLDIYKKIGDECFKSDVVWQMFKVSVDQAMSDKEFLFGILTSCTTNIQHKIILKYETSRDDILAWEEFKKEFEYDGSKELKQEQLKSLSHQIFKNSDSGGMVAYIDKFQSTMAQLETISPAEYPDMRKKRQLLYNIRQARGVSHMIQRCRDEVFWTFEMCASYLRKNAMYIDNVNSETPEIDACSWRSTFNHPTAFNHYT